MAAGIPLKADISSNREACEHALEHRAFEVMTSDRVPRRFRSMSGGAPTRNLRPAIAQKDYY